ncbi:hypothetical protein [Xanthomonas euvesicatoria]|uniref:hypothetical protein n=1 Tax=Xanthomonas euvesicatoria TaxID=456327 RepID=UPI001C4572E8|nr:hypothetical protein [Xanthomonas euvesicatoria]MBV6881991.1 hypothetical protein [Xanthomonas campestris pv. euphorbiae]
MQPVKTDDTITKTRSLAVLLKIAPFGKPLDVKAQSINELWAVGCTEDLLYELDKEGAIIFEFCSDDVLVCYTKEETPRFLVEYVEKSIRRAQSEKHSLAAELETLQGKLSSIYHHNPTELKERIHSSKRHIDEVRRKIEKNDLLRPMAEPLDEIQRHFDSLAVVAENYSSVYSNILKPIEEEGKKGIRATVFWAVAGIVVSVLLSNFGAIRVMLRAVAG